MSTRGQESAVLSHAFEAGGTQTDSGNCSRPKRSALVIDDDPDIAPLVDVALGRYDFVTESVGDGAAALLRLRSCAYDLAILDLAMAELDGFEVLQTIKRNDGLRKMPVIVLTSDASEQALARSFGFGADDFVTKPFRLNELGMRAYRLIQPPVCGPEWAARANRRGRESCPGA